MVNFLWENIFKNSSEKRDVVSILRENILFRELTKKELKFVENIIHERHYRPGETVFKQGELGVGMYIIAKGTVDITLIDSSSVGGEDSKEVHVTRLVSGDFFGEISLVEENGTRSATAVASDDTLLIGFFKPDLIEILERSPATGVKVVFKLAEVLGRRLKETTDKITQLRNELRAFDSSEETQGRGID